MSGEKNGNADKAAFDKAIDGAKHMGITMSTVVLVKAKLEECYDPSVVAAYIEQLTALEDRIAKGLPQSLLSRAIQAAFSLMVCSAFVSISIWLVVKALRLSGLM